MVISLLFHKRHNKFKQNMWNVMEVKHSSADSDTASCQRVVFSTNPQTGTNSVRLARFLCVSTIEGFGQGICVNIVGFHKLN